MAWFIPDRKLLEIAPVEVEREKVMEALGDAVKEMPAAPLASGLEGIAQLHGLVYTRSEAAGDRAGGSGAGEGNGGAGRCGEGDARRAASFRPRGHRATPWLGLYQIGSCWRSRRWKWSGRR